MRDYGLAKIGPIRTIATSTLPASAANYHDLVDAAIKPEHLFPDGVGLWWMHAPFFSFLTVGTIADVQAFRDGTPLPQNLDEFKGQVYAEWPNTEGWDELAPQGVTWNEGGEGIVGELGDRNEVVVYEWRDTKRDQLIVQWHCTVCHNDDYGYVNQGPDSRYGIAWKAMRHVRDEGHRPPDPALDRIVAKVGSEFHGRTVPIPPEGFFAASCRQSRECARIARLRERRAA